MKNLSATTVLVVRRNGKVVMASDGQVTIGDTIVKHNASKIRRLYNGSVLAGFSGSVADSLALFTRFEKHLEASRGKLRKAAVELAKDWRTDKYLRRLEALLLVANLEETLLITGSGDVLEPEEDVAAIGSGGAYALAAARALIRHTSFSAEQIAREAMRIASEICIYTNDSFTMETLEQEVNHDRPLSHSEGNR
ncbi:MAG: ATP-dependent protease subunit HslV [bacterium JZ-2024 1]